MRNGTTARLSRLVAGLVGLVASGWFLTGLAASPVTRGFPTDWSHHHVVFSRPANPQVAARIEADPRYWQQFARRNVTRVLSEDGSNAVELSASALRNALRSNTDADWSEDLGSGASVGAGNFPAKYTFQITTANCASAGTPDYVVFPTGLVGSSSQASIVGFDNLYSGCSGTVPQTYWAYNTGGPILTSPIISLDGSQIAFVQTTAGSSGQGILVLLKWKAATGTVGAPVTPANVPNSGYRICIAPCMTTVTLRTSGGTAVDDRTSSVVPDYTNDALYVGGTSSWLHKIKGVFIGSPAEVTTGGFPVQLNPGNQNTVSSPALDPVTGNIIVGDYGGYVYRVSSTGAVVRSAQLDHAIGVIDTIVDPSVGVVYAFVSNDNSTNCAGGACSGVYFLSESFGAGAAGTEARVGASSATPAALYQGDFDNNYLNSSNATGDMYVCGNTGGAPTLYQIAISNGAPGTVVTGPALSGANTGCSPTTDISNPNAAGGTNEWVFAGVQASGLGNSCASGGCVMNFITQPWQASHAYSVGQLVLDTHFQIQVVRTAGTSAATTPNWSTTIAANTNDNTVRWRNQGPQVANHASWIAHHAYTNGIEILDPNGNVQAVITAGTSGATQPVWSTIVNGQTPDGPVRWRNLGAVATASIAAAGGSSGIILDNVTPAGTTAGASQVYFSTLSNQVCATSGGTGGCAIQASQSALK